MLLFLISKLLCLFGFSASLTITNQLHYEDSCLLGCSAAIFVLTAVRTSNPTL
jgi:hypothetical protein